MFNSTIYLQADNRLCCLGTINLPGGPVNIQTSLLSLHELSVGDPWRVTNNHLMLAERYQLSIATARYRPSRLNQIDITNQRELLGEVISSIDSNAAAYWPHNQTNNPANLAQTTQIIAARLQQYCLLISQWLAASATDQKTAIPDQLFNMIGCGEGLTPAGDDILVGVLVTLRTCGLRGMFDTLRLWVLEHATGRTNKISHAHLSAACDGQAIDPLHDLLSGIADTLSTSRNTTKSKTIPDDKTLTEAIDALVHYGHSSGFYTLKGVQLVLKHLQQH